MDSGLIGLRLSYTSNPPFVALYPIGASSVEGDNESGVLLCELITATWRRVCMQISLGKGGKMKIGGIRRIG